MQILIFSVNGFKYALPNKYINELIRRQKIQPSNNHTNFFAGNTIIRNEIYACVDLSGILFNTRAKYSTNQIFVLTTTKIAYIVDSVEAVIDLNTDLIQRPKIALDNSQVDGCFKYKNDIILLLNYNKLQT